MDVPPLLEFIKRVSPEYEPPYHLAPWVEQISACLRRPVRALCSVPIRHFKSETTMHGIAWLLCNDPTLNIIYMVADDEMANNRGKRIRELCEAVDKIFDLKIGPEKKWNVIKDWRNEHGGGVLTMSGQQSKQGRNVDILIADDPVNEHDVQVQEPRDVVDRAIANYTARAMRPGKPGSVLLLMSRWHPDDPIGRRRERFGWTELHSPAILNEGNEEKEVAFCSEVLTLAQLKEIKRELKEQDPTERVWRAQYQQDPIAPGGAKFRHDPIRYEVLPTWNFRLAYGLDMAFTQGADSDYCAIVCVKIMADQCFIVDVQRYKLDAHQIEAALQKMRGEHGDGPIFSYVSGPEKGFVRLLRRAGLPVQPMLARYNKLVRAEKTARRWNDHCIHVPLRAPWAPGFIRRMTMFTGRDGASPDDETDALVSVCDGAMGGVAAGITRTLGRAYQGLSTAYGAMRGQDQGGPRGFWTYEGPK